MPLPSCSQRLGGFVATFAANQLSGEEHRSTVLHAHGSIEAPLSDAQLETKFRDNARLGGSGCDVDAALTALWGLDDAADVNDLMRALAAREGSESA